MKNASNSVHCKIEGCKQTAVSPSLGVCQKHYFRFRRTGTYELLPKQKRATRRQDPRGYWQLYMPNHPLADSTGYVWEHRKLMHDKYGSTLPNCELCGKHITWETAHIDHKDETPSNNDTENLRPLCRVCNVGRTLRCNLVLLTVDGITKTASEWSKDPAVKFCYRSILRRRAAGMSDWEVLFGKKRTHNGNGAEVRRMKRES